MPRKPCAAPGCSKLLEISETYCDAHAVQDKRERGLLSDKARSKKPYRKWYKRVAWCGATGRRKVQLAKTPLCEMCPEHSKNAATVADHIEPHNGDHAKFWFGKLQSLCAPCHDIRKQRAENRAKGG